MVKLREAIKHYRKFFISRMMRPAKAERIIQYIKSHRWVFINVLLTSYLFLSVVLTSYLISNKTYCVLTLSYAMFSPYNRRKNPFDKDFWVENLGGSGPRVAAYLRVSTDKQVRGMSLEVQKEKIEKMKIELKPSRVYWFVDAGMSGEDFDRRKITRILEFRENNEIDELWVSHLDRIGRTCRKSLLFFLQFAENDGIIRTPEKTFTTKELADILLYTIESFGAESENKRRAERANASKIQNFKSKKWNKNIPIGYVRDGEWIKKVQTYTPIIQEIFSTFVFCKCINRTSKIINSKYGKVLNKPLKRGRLRHLLSDPVYIGHPTLMQTVVIDESLRFVQDEIFNECQKLLKKEEQKPKESSTIAKLALTYELSILDFIEEVADFHHKGCGGILVKNGTRFEGLILQQAFKCNLCGAEFRIPTKTMLNRTCNLNRQHETAPEKQVTGNETSEALRKEISSREPHEKTESQGANPQKLLTDF